jgi:arylsulfatase A-like enzyme
MPRFFIFTFLALTTLARTGEVAGEDTTERPNIVWIVTEDNSKHWLRLYDPGGAPMPNIERLAAQGLVFNHAFSNAPVCSVARSTIISGCYAPRVGAQYHRRAHFAPLPGNLRMFPHYLREVGYYTSNNSKEDYNFPKTETAWDESSRRATYRNRVSGQPFFHVQNYTTTHEGKLHFTAEQMQDSPTVTDPTSMQVFPYHPDTATFRYTYALEHDHHRDVDAEIGQFLDQLESDGLMDDTIVFYYGDHGGVLPRSKGYVYESGLHVPMVVYTPEKWRHLFPAGPGNRIDGFVSFVDLAPTVLNLAGSSIPDEMDGRPFLGPGVTLESLNARDTAFGYADRFDEKYDLVRTWRQGKFKYVRSYQPFNYDGLYNFYRYKMLAYQQWRELYQAGKLNAQQRQFFEPRRAECLYDLEADPHEVNNLAGDPDHANVLARMRKSLQRHVKSMPDLSFYPESFLLKAGMDNPVQFGQTNKQAIARFVDIADLSLRPFAAAEAELLQVLRSTNPWERYWGLIVCSAFGKVSQPLVEAANQLAKSDSENLVRVRAAEFLGLIDAADPRQVITEALKNASDETEANLILNSVTLLRGGRPSYQFEISSQLFPADWPINRGQDTLIGRRLDYLGGSD